MKQSTFKNRKPKSDIARNFIGVIQRDSKGRPRVLRVPGSNGKQYDVIIRRFSSLVTMECRLVTGCGHLSCPGNSHRKHNPTICYHSRAALDFCLDEAEFQGFWCQTEDDAQLLHRAQGGYIQEVKSHQNNVSAYVLVVKR